MNEGPIAAEVAAPLACPEPQRLRFTGTGREYFGIWVVNLSLTLLTIGIYSPWAKVRRIRYFYGNTLLDGSPFEFHGAPAAVLKGRLIALVLLIAYSQAAKISLFAWYVVVAVLIAMLPWLLWRSLRFRMANTSYRGIRFGFAGTLVQAYATFVPLILMVLGPTLVLAIMSGEIGPRAPDAKALVAYGIAILLVAVLAPWFFYRLRAFRQRNTRLGAQAFGFNATVGSGYRVSLKIGGVFLLLLIGAMVVGGGGLAIAVAALPSSFAVPGTVVAVTVGYLFVLAIYPLSAARVQNFVWNHTRFNGERFESSARGGALLRIDASNVVAFIVTLGFFWPFAMIRRTRYRVEAMRYDGDPSTLVAAGAASRVGAAGEEAADLFGFDLAL